MNNELFVIFGWGSPIGVGIFLIALAAMIYILSKAGKNKKQD